MANVFKVAQPPAVNTNAMRPVVAAPPGTQILRSITTGVPLPPSSQDAKGYDPLIPWPASKPLESQNKPYKGLK